MYDLAVSTAKAEIRAETRSEIRREIFERDTAVRRLAVVGQLSLGPQEPTHTVVLGPFYAPHKLSTEERFREAVAKPCAPARDAGRRLAWDYKTGRSRGRFMLAPAFMGANEAWDFYRGSALAETAVQALADPIVREIVPVCSCGLKARIPCRWCGQDYDHHCPLHDQGAQAHQCRRAA